MRDSKRRNGNFTVRRITVTEHGVRYQTWQLVGYLNGERIRKKFKSHEEALGAKNRFEVKAANGGEVAARVTRLTAEQLAEAEAAFAVMKGQPLSLAIEWFKKTYRPPVSDTSLTHATASFLADRAAHVRPVMLRNYRHTMQAFTKAFPERRAHEISTADVQKFLDGRKVGKKRFNNLRGDLHALFAYCQATPRAWVRENPVSPIPWFRIPRGLPEILNVQTVLQVMQYVESYAGGPRSNALLSLTVVAGNEDESARRFFDLFRRFATLCSPLAEMTTAASTRWTSRLSFAQQVNLWPFLLTLRALR